MDLGEGNSGNPATTADAKNYEVSHGYASSPVQVVADPGWQKIGQAVQHPGTTLPLPYFIVFDSKMNIVYVGGGGNTAAFEAVTGAVQQATGVAFEGGGSTADGSCQGFCGGQAAAGCYCDAECHNYGDCCSDACELCGFCP